MNNEPTIIQQVPQTPTVSLVSEQQMVWVQVRDLDEEDVITMNWWVDNQLIQSLERVYSWQDGTGLWNSRLRISTSTEQDGSQITCFFTDGEHRGNVTWEVIVP